MGREIKVLSTTAMKTTLDDLMPEFEKSTGNKVTIHFAPSAKIKQRVADGEETDVAIATAEGLEDLIQTNKIVDGFSRRSRAIPRRPRGAEGRAEAGHFLGGEVQAGAAGGEIHRHQQSGRRRRERRAHRQGASSSLASPTR